MFANNKGGMVLGFIIGVLFVIIAASYFLPVSSSMKNSIAKDLLSCPSQTMNLASMMKDKKLTYYEYFIFKFNCSSKKVEEKVKKAVK